MQASRFVEALTQDLAAVARLGDDATSAAAERLIASLQASVGLRLLEALSEAALELSGQLPSGHVEVRLAGQDPQLVYVEDAPEPVPAGAEETTLARISLRLPEDLKVRVEVAASTDGLSVNAWLVQAIARALTGGVRTQRGPGRTLRGYAQS
jgi:HicB family